MLDWMPSANAFLSDFNAKGVSTVFREVLNARLPQYCGSYAAWRAAADLGYERRGELSSIILMGDSYHKMNHLMKFSLESPIGMYGPFPADAVDIRTNMKILGCKAIGMAEFPAKPGAEPSNHIVYIKGIEGGECTVEDNCRASDFTIRVSDLKSVCYIEPPGGVPLSRMRPKEEEPRELDHLIDDFMRGEYRTDRLYRREIVSHQVGATNRVFYRDANPKAEKVSAKDTSDISSDVVMQILAFMRASENRFTIFGTFQRGVDALANPELLDQVAKVPLPQRRTGEVSLEELGNGEIRYFGEVGRLFRPHIEELKRRQGLADDWKMDLSFDLFSEVPKFRGHPEAARLAAGRALVFSFAILAELGTDPIKVLDRGKARLMKEKVYKAVQETSFRNDFSSIPGYLTTGYIMNEGVATGRIVVYNQDRPEQTRLEDGCILVTSTGDEKLQDFILRNGDRIGGMITSAAQNSHASITWREQLKKVGLACADVGGLAGHEGGVALQVAIDNPEKEGYARLLDSKAVETWESARRLRKSPG